MSKTQVNIDNDKLQVAAEILRAINHKLRMKILAFIDQNDKINVNKIYNTLNLEQSITSQHLRILRNAGVVDTQRDGKFIYYEINYDRVNQAIESIDKFLAE
jgi:DNA-binding transcriptional ArsR family regulator